MLTPQAPSLELWPHTPLAFSVTESVEDSVIFRL